MSTTGETDRAICQRLTICNKRGLHARASARFVHIADYFDANVTVTRDGVTVGGTSIMGLMMLAAGPGSTILVQATGREARQAIEALTDLVNNGFDEDSEGAARAED
ncbi:HPr family phosphocarrier protein [Pelagibacterium limicola]|uniref:HPr family phosphocarrier protein n=1 Tax=Pelagibacterium limicola TaxID=2791022 RepID=UPI0018AF6073|nr:HPr family phosphocarrier protein [Pelagibacterium limicola]